MCQRYLWLAPLLTPLRRLINTATIAYGSLPSFIRFAPSQPDFATIITEIVLELPNLIDIVGEKKVLEWGATDGVRIQSGETWHETV